MADYDAGLSITTAAWMELYLLSGSLSGSQTTVVQRPVFVDSRSEIFLRINRYRKVWKERHQHKLSLLQCCNGTYNPERYRLDMLSTCYPDGRNDKGLSDKRQCIAISQSPGLMIANFHALGIERVVEAMATLHS